MSSLRAVFTHLGLPCHLPGSADDDSDALSRDVLKRATDACDTMLRMVYEPWHQAFQNLSTSLAACAELHDGFITKSKLLDHFCKLCEGPMLILHVQEQNAGLLVRVEDLDDGRNVIFEAFEA
ncbi:hypothetical protein JX266_014038 [Neoarthrinium moseri]|nr:hypothetical protein JX266_014038 [Neoarthrinium moseri]